MSNVEKSEAIANIETALQIIVAQKNRMAQDLSDERMNDLASSLHGIVIEIGTAIASLDERIKALENKG